VRVWQSQLRKLKWDDKVDTYNWRANGADLILQAAPLFLQRTIHIWTFENGVFMVHNLPDTTGPITSAEKSVVEKNIGQRPIVVARTDRRPGTAHYDSIVF
jgi:hypothetical protein